MSKLCWQCKEVKSSSSFNKNRSKPDGLSTECKECNKNYRLLNKERLRKNRAEYYANNKDRELSNNKKYSEANPHVMRAKDAKRRASKINRTPKWLTEFDLDYIKSIYAQAKFFGMHVDHIVPLQGKTVSGLHVPWNLQLLTPEDNLRKSNKF